MPVKMSLSRGFIYQRNLICSDEHNAYYEKLISYESKMPTLGVGDLVSVIFRYSNQEQPKINKGIITRIDDYKSAVVSSRKLYWIKFLSGEVISHSRICIIKLED